ncbi:putative transcriptional regulator [Saccharolobus solfataricus rod-shaped virus 1]|uniref:Putative transcriptional regulator n=1 Tax=Saccharolobus solfataricus rod-shaped virus 1 TaxID=2730619 RepID=A0A6M3VZJ7_SSRV1|nr:putative transcriptional regulator [Saccharolobus solfataricus rod-shaped virus 1]QJF12313.1 putative transcriptional regulator [Saccharolobus solfataricus rod-shaped virus 1]
METQIKPKLTYCEKLILLYLLDSKLRYGEDAVWLNELYRVFWDLRCLLRLERAGLVKIFPIFCSSTKRFRHYAQLTHEGEEVAKEIYQSLI